MSVPCVKPAGQRVRCLLQVVPELPIAGLTWWYGRVFSVAGWGEEVDSTSFTCVNGVGQIVLKGNAVGGITGTDFVGGVVGEPLAPEGLQVRGCFNAANRVDRARRHAVLVTRGRTDVTVPKVEKLLEVV